MPLTQNAPREDGCAGLGAILLTRPSSIVSNEPHNAEHSQHVLGTVTVADTFEGRTFIAISSCASMLHRRSRSASRRLQRQRFRIQQAGRIDDRSPSTSSASHAGFDIASPGAAARTIAETHIGGFLRTPLELGGGCGMFFEHALTSERAFRVGPAILSADG